MKSLPLINLWHEKSLLLHWSFLNMKLRYKGTYLGLLWSALEPLFMFVILYIVFTTIRETRSDYAIYLISGIAMYSTFQRGTINGLSSLIDNSGLLKSLNLRREFFPVSSMMTSSLFMVVKIGILFALMPIFNFIPSWTIVLFPIPLLMLLLLILGLSYMLSIATIYFRDIQPLWSVFTYGLLFITPIFWYEDQASGVLLQLQSINPLGQLVEIFHKIILGTIPTMGEWIYSFAFVFGIFFLGYGLFQKYEKKIVEVL